MPRYPGGLRRGTPGASPLEDVLGTPDHGGESPPFKVFRGVTQGDSLSPTIFKVVFDAVLWHWVTVVAEEEAGPEGFGPVVRSLTALFCANDGLLASTRAEMLEWVSGALADLFDRVGLGINVQNTVGMVCQPCRSPGGHSAEAHDRQMRGEGQAYEACQKRWVFCTECAADLATGFLAAHHQTQPGVGRGGARVTPPRPE